MFEQFILFFLTWLELKVFFEKQKHKDFMM